MQIKMMWKTCGHQHAKGKLLISILIGLWKRQRLWIGICLPPRACQVAHNAGFFGLIQRCEIRIL